MRTPTGAGRFTGLLGRTLLCAGLAAGTGCATLRATVAGYATGADGISRRQQQLRAAIAEGEVARALVWREDDALLRSLTTGVAAYRAAQFARSAAVLDTAALLADDRITASLSRDGLALVTNDMARPYQPRRTERLFIPYYAMLAYVQLGAWEDAAVEARRLVGLLAQFDDDRDDDERDVHGAMQHLAGAVFERAGERNEARVAYRAAHAMVASAPESIDRGSIADEGELLVVVERGFVAHRATETMSVYLNEHDRDSRRHEHEDDDDDGDRLTIVFPSLRASARPWGGALRLAVDGSVVDGMDVVVKVDDASAVDARRERVAIATRAVTRAAAKYIATKAIKDKKGEVVGSIANFGASLLDRADVRSWHLLPQEIALLRTRVPAGRRAVEIQIGEGLQVRTTEVGNVLVRRGELTIVPVRLWRDPAPAPAAGPPSPVVEEASTLCATFFCP